MLTETNNSTSYLAKIPPDNVLARQFVEKLSRKVEELSNIVINGTYIDNYEDFKYYQGYMRGVKETLSMYSDIWKDYFQEDGDI